MTNLDDVTNKAQAFLKDEKVTDALKSNKVEGVSDSILDAVAGAADKLTGGKFHDQIDSARDTADKRVGDE